MEYSTGKQLVEPDRGVVAAIVFSSSGPERSLIRHYALSLVHDEAGLAKIEVDPRFCGYLKLDRELLGMPQDFILALFVAPQQDDG